MEPDQGWWWPGQGCRLVRRFLVPDWRFISELAKKVNWPGPLVGMEIPSAGLGWLAEDLSSNQKVAGRRPY